MVNDFDKVAGEILNLILDDGDHKSTFDALNQANKLRVLALRALLQQSLGGARSPDDPGALKTWGRPMAPGEEGLLKTWGRPAPSDENELLKTWGRPRSTDKD